MDLVVTYNNQTISPTPLVNQSYSFLDTPIRQGNINNITLQGYLTGYASVSDATNQLQNLYSGQFGTINISDTNGAQIYSWPNLYLENITTDLNHFFSGSFIKYSVKFKEFNVPSGVYDYSNIYEFSQGEDGIIGFTHKISAKGIKNSIGAFQNAVNFVQTYTGINTFSPVFIPNGNGVLLSVSENIDRMACTYSVVQQFKYNSGANQDFITNFSVDISDVMENEYVIIDANLKLKGSPIINNLTGIEASLPSINSFLNLAEIPTSLIIPYSMSVNRNDSASLIEIKTSYISGYGGKDISGFLDYVVTYDYDVVLPKETWKVEGDFVCKGPLSYRQQQLQNFKNLYNNYWDFYASGLITGSDLFSAYHTPGNLMSAFNVLEIKENTGMAQFSLSYVITDGSELGLPNPTYQVSVIPSIYQFNYLQSCNIEGAGTIQDPQMRSRGKISIETAANFVTSGALSYADASMIGQSLSGIYIGNAMAALVKENFETGLLDISYEAEYLGQDTQSTGILFNKILGSSSEAFSRSKGFLFGY